jgi:dienelactone hydrolase
MSAAMLRLRTRSTSVLLGIIASLAIMAAAPAAESAARDTGPWDMTKLKSPPAFTWGTTTGVVREVYYEGEPLAGKPTRVFAYYARPEGPGPFPAMLLVHGGGGQAFSQWAELWAKRGYAALAMDTAGQGPGKKRMDDGGPNQDDQGKFRDFNDTEVNQMWTYHAVAAVVRGHSLLASLPEVDPARIGMTGISWGGYLTCIVTGVDDRLKVSVPVYGCGFLHENSAWIGRLAKMKPEQRERWVRWFDPSRYLPEVSCPILFVNGTNDFAYPLDSYQKSYRAVPGHIDLCIRVAMPHGHSVGWAPVEIGLFVDSVLTGGVPLATIEPMQTKGNGVQATFSSKTPIVTAQLHYTTDGGAWQQRKWQSIPAKLAGNTASADLPSERPLVYYLSITDDRRALVSTPHAVLSEEAK